MIFAMQEVTEQLRNFIQYIAVQFIEHPDRAQLKVAELGPQRVRFKLVLEKSDVAFLIGRSGFSASAIRGVMKSSAEKAGVHATLQIHSHEEEEALLAQEGQSGDEVAGPDATADASGNE